MVKCSRVKSPRPRNRLQAKLKFRDRFGSKYPRLEFSSWNWSGFLF